MMLDRFLQNTKNNWQKDWANLPFRRKFLLIWAVGVVILVSFPHFFQFIQQRSGVLLDDWFLATLPAKDVSLAIFISLWGSGVLLAMRAIENPRIMLMFVLGYILLTLSRFITITLFPLEPPLNLIELVDPLSNAFYGKSFVTKDLFFSGHTSSALMIFLCLEKKREKLFTLVATCVVGFGVLVQHIHYTIDVLAVPFFTYGCFWLAKLFLEEKNKR